MGRETFPAAAKDPVVTSKTDLIKIFPLSLIDRRSVKAFTQEKSITHAQIENIAPAASATLRVNACENSGAASFLYSLGVVNSPSEMRKEKNPIDNDDIIREIRIIPPAAAFASMETPTVPITKAGPALTQKSIIL